MTEIGWKELSDKEREWRSRYFAKGPKTDLVRFDNGFLIKRRLALNMEKMQDFKYRDDDILIMSHPKTGSTWAQETVWLMVHDLDIVTSKNVSKRIRTPAIKKLQDESFGKKFFENMQGRRVIKCHIPFVFLPDNLLERCKVIYMARNPKDTAVSFYHHLKRKGHFEGDFRQFAEYFRAELLHYSYWDHLHAAWERRHHRNMKLLWYEDMKEDTRGVIDQLAEFLHHPLSREQKILLCEQVEFSNMKKNVNAYNNTGYNNNASEIHFMRKGVVGDWVNHFDEETNQDFNEWTQGKIRGSGMEDLEIFKHILVTSK